MPWLVLRLVTGFVGAWLLVAGLANLVGTRGLGFMFAVTGAGLLLAAAVGPRDRRTLGDR